jgi:hypothetical protein
MRTLKPSRRLVVLSICSAVIVLAIQLAPVWALSWLLDLSFWRALAVWAAGGLVLWAFTGFYRFVAWRLCGKALATARILHILREAQFPQRFWKGDSFETYLYRIKDPDYGFTEETRVLAQMLELESDGFTGFTSSRSAIRALRFDGVGEAALEAYSPLASAPNDVREGCIRMAEAAQERRVQEKLSELTDYALAVGAI